MSDRLSDAIRNRWGMMKQSGFDAPVSTSDEEDAWASRTGRLNRQWSNPGPYFTQLSPEEKDRFVKWAFENLGQGDYQRMGSPYSDYDHRGFWKAATSGDPRASLSVNQSDNRVHAPDIWKTPFHESFSNESMYATQDAPKWVQKGKDWFLVDRSGNVLRREIEQ